MSPTHSADTCPEERLGDLLTTLQAGGGGDIREVDRLTSEYPRDPRLQFLRGSLLAGRQDYAGAEASMRRALDLAPGYAVVRFQLGLLLLTTGRSYAAEETWGPLHALSPAHYLRLFVAGLIHLMHERFDEAVGNLQEGIGRNQENAPMNRDMEMIVQEIEQTRSRRSHGTDASSVGLRLQQAALRTSKH